MQAIVNRGSFPTGMTKERAASLGASVAVNLAMIAAFASIANIDAEKVSQGAALVVVGLSGSTGKADAAETKPPPSLSAPAPPPAQPAPPALTPEAIKNEPDERKLALLEPLEHAADGADGPAARSPSERHPPLEQLHQAAEQRRTQEGAKARGEEAENEAKSAVSAQPAVASSATIGGSGGYGAVIFRHLQRFKRANSVGAGTALVRVAIDRDGSVRDAAILRSSGIASFDREALQTVWRASPFPKPPGDDGRTINFAFTGR